MSLFDRAPVSLPNLPDSFDYSGIACQITGGALPSLTVGLQPGQSVEINPANLLWKDEATVLRHSIDGMALAIGPARFGLSLRVPGQIFPLPLLKDDVVQVRSGHFLFAAGTERQIGQLRGLAERISGGAAVGFDSFEATGQSGIVWAQAAGSVLERALGEGEILEVRPEAFLAMDESVDLRAVVTQSGNDPTDFAWPCLRLVGPGRVAVQNGVLAPPPAPAAPEPAAPRHSVFGFDLPIRGKR